jgi:hypothetical protein
MDRRQFLSLSSKRQQVAQAMGTNTRRLADSGIDAYTGTFDTDQITHLLKRTLFGCTIDDIAWARGLGLDATIEALLAPQTLPSPPVNTYGDDESGVPVGQTWVTATPCTTDDWDGLRVNNLSAWWWGLYVNQSRTLTDKMMLYWNNHFSIEMDMIHDARYCYNYLMTIRKNCLGSFKELTKQITLDPAMLVYLNNNENDKKAAIENYARELQELFTVGKGPDSQYTEDDVRAAARVMTGYKIDAPSAAMYFETTLHDIENKQFSSFYNNTKITGRTGPDGLTELDDMLDMIFATQECAKYIVRTIYRWFVYYVIDDTVEANVITPLADTFRSSGYDITVLMRTLLKSQHFFDPANMSALIKSPVDFSIGMCREFGVKFPTAQTDAYDAWGNFWFNASNMLQKLGKPPLVAGWAPYYQEPQYHEMWINTDTYPKRKQVSDGMISTGGFSGVSIDPVAFATKLPNPSDPAALISDSLSVLFRMPISDASKANLKNTILLSGQNPDSDYYWTDAWNTMVANPTDMTARQIIDTRLRALYQYVMGLAEYQLS